jgi:2-polyprenyl-6-methoxyphenol hydroxylase-like FAD-dependent oxidoreductase
LIIVGGGVGGLSAARALRGAPVRVTLIDKPSASTGTGVSSAWSLPQSSTYRRKASTSGSSNALVAPTQSASVELSKFDTHARVDLRLPVGGRRYFSPFSERDYCIAQQRIPPGKLAQLPERDPSLVHFGRQSSQKTPGICQVPSAFSVSTG